MDNQPINPQLPVPEPDNNQPNRLLDFVKKHRLLLLTGGVVVFLAVLILVLTTRQALPNTNQDGSQAVSQFRNWLVPSKELKVGDYRYVSTCQALTKQNVTEILGKFADDGIVLEEYLDENYTAISPSDEFKGECSYELKNAEYTNAVLTSEQFVDKEQAKKVFNFVVMKPDAMQAKVAELTTAAEGNEAARSFAVKLKTSSERYPELSTLTYKSNELSKVSVDGLLFPDSRNRYVLFYQNSVYALRITPVDKNMKQADLLAAYGELFAAIEANIKNNQLDQSPAPTLLGNTDRVTKTIKVIEPCAILNRANFAAITGTEQDKPTSRTSLPYELEDIVQNKQLMVANACERQSGRGSSAPSNRVNLTLRHASSVQGAIDWLGSDQGITPLATDADQSFILNPRFKGDYPIYYFRVGPYVADIDILQTSSDGTFSGISQKEATNDQYIKAINILVAELKKNL